ncbi:DNA-binding SARP family transcriptional activator/tetratricopeptide (TPR) repeat protein [Variovorax paradoxus]
MRDSLWLFGTPSIRFAQSGHHDLLGDNRPAALIAYVASQPGWVSRESLADVLRPDANAHTARAYLRRLLHRTHELFPSMSSLVVEDTRIRWSGECDVRAFEHALDQADWTGAIALQQEAYLTGLQATGLPFLDEWFVECRVRLWRRLSVALMAAITAARNRTGADRVDLMRRLAEHDPLDENAVQFLLANARSQLEQHTAMAAFQTLSRLFATQLGKRPSPETVAIHEQLAGRGAAAMPEDGSPHEFPAAEKAGEHSTLGAVLPQLPGREAELRDIELSLADANCRLVTISGFGGVGKTRLARTIYERFVCDAAVPSAWIDLLPVESGHGLRVAIASALNMPPQHGPIEDQLVEWLRVRRFVLFLDNFEQLGEHRGFLSTLLQASAGLRFVVTSREPLKLPDERIFALAGLDAKGADSAAARLFEVLASRMGHPVAPGDCPQVAELVAYLDGLPLAIELAASWLPLFPVRLILEELRKDPLFIDAATNGQSLARRSMTSVFEATWRRLTSSERHVLTAISTVVGSLSIEMGRSIAGATASALMSLIGKSLLQRVAPTSFRLHPLLRELIKTHACEGALLEARQRHAAFFLNRVAAPPALKPGQFQSGRIDELKACFDDLSHAWRFAVDTGEHELIGRALPNMDQFLFIASRFEDAVELSDYALRAGARGRIAHRLASWHAASSIRLGRMDEAEQKIRATLSLGPVGAVFAWLHVGLARIYWFRGRYDTALSHADLALRSAEADDVFLRMVVIEELAQCHYALGELSTALAYLQENRELAAKHQARHIEGRSLQQLGVVNTAADRPQDAVKLLEASIAVFQEMDDTYQVATSQRAMSYSYYRLRDPAAQMFAARAALETFRAGAYQHEVGESLFAVATALDAAGDHFQSMLVSRDALVRCQQVNNIPAAMRCVGALGVFAIVLLRDRELGLAVLEFALNQPEFRRTDRVIFERRLSNLGVSEAEREQARQRAKDWTFSRVCAMLLSLSTHT